MLIKEYSKNGHSVMVVLEGNKVNMYWDGELFSSTDSCNKDELENQAFFFDMFKAMCDLS